MWILTHQTLKSAQKVCGLNDDPQLPASSKCALLAAVLRSYPLGWPGAECGQDEE